MAAESGNKSKARIKIRIDGWVLIDKDPGITSASVVNKVRGMLSAIKAGHAGTLDPLATGLLPLAFGEATKTIPYIVDSEKTYEFAVQWGQSRNTDDAEGEISGECEKIPSNEEIDGALANYLGEIEQVPPIFSAIKLDGQRAYDLARKGFKPELKSRKVKIIALVSP